MNKICFFNLFNLIQQQLPKTFWRKMAMWVIFWATFATPCVAYEYIMIQEGAKISVLCFVTTYWNISLSVAISDRVKVFLKLWSTAFLVRKGCHIFTYACERNDKHLNVAHFEADDGKVGEAEAAEGNTCYTAQKTTITFLLTFCKLFDHN